MKFLIFRFWFFLLQNCTNVWRLNSVPLVSTWFDVEKFSHEIDLNGCCYDDDEDLNKRPSADVAFVVLDESKVAWLSSTGMCLVLWPEKGKIIKETNEDCSKNLHHVQIPLDSLHDLREIVHVYIQVLDFFRELFPVIVFDDSNIKVDEFSGETRKLVIYTNGIVTAGRCTVGVVRIGLPKN